MHLHRPARKQKQNDDPYDAPFLSGQASHPDIVAVRLPFGKLLQQLEEFDSFPARGGAGGKRAARSAI